ncbi:MAG: hypothetical protein M0017_13370 [Desulfobacteraceae bacterium]|nr:hypothetical protein [Desulfobacteraceae bacterium]
MKPNVVIMTGGLSGSSVLAHLIAREGFWLGDSVKKIDYKTFENSQLVDLNDEILKASGYGWIDVMDIPPPSVTRIEQAAQHAEGKFPAFVETCDANGPWLWKDPRLSYTIYFWKRFLQLEKCKFILMSRDIRQTWTGIVLRGKMPISFADLRAIERNCIGQAREFLAREKIDYLAMTFEELITRPEESLAALNGFLGLGLTLDHLGAVYKGPLHRVRWSRADFLKARLRFAYYKHWKRDAIVFPRKWGGKGSGCRHLNLPPLEGDMPSSQP